MRYPSHRTPTRTNSTGFIKWGMIIGVILIVMFSVQGLQKSSTHENGDGWKLSGSGKAIIVDSNGKKRDVSTDEVLSDSDSLLSVISGMILIENNGTQSWIDKGANITPRVTASGKSLEVVQGRMWIETVNPITIKLKHIEVRLPANSITLLEQQKIHSIAYALKGPIDVSADEGTKKYLLQTGTRIMVSQSDLVSPGADLAKLSDSIDDTIKQTALFLARDGEKLLSSLESTTTMSGDTLIGSGEMMLSSGTQNITQYISITSPTDGSLIGGSDVSVEGKILNSSVSRIFINDKEVLGKGANTNFSIKNIPIVSDSLDIVYKAYDAGGNLLERGVITVYSSEKKQGTDKLIPTTFTTSDTYKILSPAENPYKTTLGAITVSGSVPKGNVEYITVNNFRLKKFIPQSTSWYYYANIAYGTMKEGFNLYEIKFFDANNNLLSAQLFTIIKEGNSSTLSGE